MTDIVVFAEEPSGKIVAEELARRLGFADRTICVEHQGKSDLERSFPIKIRAWTAPKPPRFIVMRDNDGADCFAKKGELAALVPTFASSRVKIRLVLQEIESWYLGDPEALTAAGLIDRRAADALARDRKLRQPDRVQHAKQLFRAKVAPRGQIELARLLGPKLSLTNNRSVSFHAFIGALKWASQAG